MASLSRDWVKKTEKEVSGILKITAAKKNWRVLDLPCGAGRHSLELAQRGLSVTGVDYSADFIKVASAAAKKQKNSPFFQQGDMRKLSFHNEFDLALNLFTSFGYFKNPSDDLKALKQYYAALKPGGLLLIDTINPGFLEAHQTLKSWDALTDGTYLLRESQPFSKDGIDRAHWIFLKNGKKTEMFSEIRTYTPEKLSALLKKAAFTPKATYGCLSGSPYYKTKSFRVVVLAQK